jgi:hypothetical protein
VLLQQCKEFCKKLGFKAVLDKIKDFVPAKVGVSFQGTGVTLDRATANNTIEDALAILLEALETYQKLKVMGFSMLISDLSMLISAVSLCMHMSHLCHVGCIIHRVLMLPSLC